MKMINAALAVQANCRLLSPVAVGMFICSFEGVF